MVANLRYIQLIYNIYQIHMPLSLLIALINVAMFFWQLHIAK